MSGDEWKTKGNGHLKRGEFKQAVDCYTSGLELEKTNHALYSNRSCARLQLGLYEEALSDANRCIMLKQDWFKGYLRKANVFRKLGNIAQATKAIQQGLNKIPESTRLKTELEKLIQASPKSYDYGNFQEKLAMQLAQIFMLDVSWQKLKASPQSKHLVEDDEFKQKIEKIKANPRMMSMFLQDKQIKLALQVLTGSSI